jgi:hypothetical protein
MTDCGEAAYVAALIMLYIDLPDTPLRPCREDHSTARKLYHQGVLLSLVEGALLLASLRRAMRQDRGLPPLPPIRSLAYFQPVIAELQQQPLPDGYLDYLRRKFQKAAIGPRKTAPLP